MDKLPAFFADDVVHLWAGATYALRVLHKWFILWQYSCSPTGWSMVLGHACRRSPDTPGQAV
eukprot:2280795-Pyramimonas_sp.AAC.1